MKKIITLIAILFATYYSKAQEIPLDIIERVNSVDYIFEGEVISSQAYEAQSTHVIYTSNLIQITKILKGNLACGTIELITQGGEINGRANYTTHTLGLNVGDNGIFLARDNNWELSQTNIWNPTNSFAIVPYFENQSFISYSIENNQIIAHDILGNYDSIAQLYNLAELITGLNFQDCNNSLTFAQPIPIPNPDISEQFTAIKKQDFDIVNNWIDYQRTNYKRKKQRINSELTYSFVNPMVTGTTTKYFEFDIRLVDNMFNKYFDLAIIRIKYPTSIFDTNVVANNKISFTRGNIISDTNCYFSPTATDFVSDAFYIDVSEKVYSQCKSQLTNIPNTLVHVKMQMKDCIPNNFIKMEDTLVFGGLAYLMDAYYSISPNDTFSTAYDTTFFPAPTTIPNCVATITSFNPDTVRGGIGDTLTIRGFQFGPIRGNGNLSFVNANNPNSSNYLNLEASDYLLWSDTIIKIIVPSIDAHLVDRNPIGSCKFVLKNNISQIDTSDTRLTIFYSLKNRRDSIGGKVPAVFYNQLNGGYKFYVDTLIYQNDSMMWCINKAIREWRCATGMNFTIVKDTFNEKKIDYYDALNFIYLADSLPQSAIANLTPFLDVAPNGMKVVIEMDLGISKYSKYPYFYDTLGQVSPNRYDFYNIILHEFGHAVNHAHTNEPNSIMYPFVVPVSNNPIPFANRKVLIMDDKAAWQGGRKQVNIQLNSSANSFGYTNMVVLPLCFGYTFLSPIEKSKTDISLYPNPINSKFNVSLGDNETIKKLELFNNNGQLLYEWNNINTNSNIFEFPTNLNSGLLFLRISTNLRSETKKIIHE